MTGRGSSLTVAEAGGSGGVKDDGSVDPSSRSSLSTWESRRGSGGNEGCGSASGSPTVANRGAGLMPALAASTWTSRREEAPDKGLELPWEHSVCCRAWCEDGVEDLETCLGGSLSCRWGRVRCWRRWVDVWESWNS